MICNLLTKAQQGDDGAMLELVNRFQPLLNKYAKKLGYDDAYGDCQLFFIELVKTMDWKKLNEQNDQIAVSYISVSVKNYYCKRKCKVHERGREIIFSELTDEQRYWIEVTMAKSDEIDIFIEFGMDTLLSEEEWEILYLVYGKGYTVAELARRYHKSRQALNQLKQRTLNKLKVIERE